MIQPCVRFNCAATCARYRSLVLKGHERSPISLTQARHEVAQPRAERPALARATPDCVLAPAIYDLGSIRVSKSRTLISVRRHCARGWPVTDVNRNGSFSGCAFALVLREVNRARSKLLGEVRQGRARQDEIFERRLQRSIAPFDTSRFPSRKRTCAAAYAFLALRKRKKKESFSEMPRAGSHDLSHAYSRIYSITVIDDRSHR